jgi:hypothetical protein
LVIIQKVCGETFDVCQHRFVFCCTTNAASLSAPEHTYIGEKKMKMKKKTGESINKES